ncbi:hypothetical protein GX51_06278 [Blastomyces parvus]|uniref:Uncharacterized protein n=1 Tax=Blastomyces parvus TaxID=2060905 RepID=A0A2B7WSI2_9EURO|nr:hypothetical protein GX51_06278 [Blastomyces parvus]
MNLSLGVGTLETEFSTLMERKENRGHSDELCASHDMAPIIERAFWLKWDDIKKEKELKLKALEKPKCKQIQRKKSRMDGLLDAFKRLERWEGFCSNFHMRLRVGSQDEVFLCIP